VGTSASPGRRARLCLRTLVRGWPWYYETRRLLPDEVLLRAIPNATGYVKEKMGIWTVDPYAFEPHPRRDIDGMSFFRADFATPVQVCQTNRHAYGARVARITMQQLRSLGLDADPDPDPEQLAGHALVPGMRFVRTLPREEKRKIKDLSQKLALFATGNGLYSPPGLGAPAA
jgi:hypothetical protein